MNQRPTLLKPVGPASLADEEDFRLGAILVRPSLCEVEADQARERLEPRVMQVLVALARASGTVVSRDELILRCWGGRVVGEDAINRCVSKVRQLAELGGAKAFEIDTVPRVGYRLRLCGGAGAGDGQVAATSPVATAPDASRWRGLGLAIIALAIVACSAAALYYYLRPEPQWTVAESRLPFISTPAIERYPALSPDGTMIAYSQGPTIHNRHIALSLVNGGDAIQITHDAHDASAPAWSPDGRNIAYVIFERDHPCRIMEIPVPSGLSRQIGQCRVSERSSLAFDRSGRSVYYNDAPARGAPDRILKLDLDDGHVSVVTHPGGGTADGSPSFSPDGRILLYQRDLSGLGVQIRQLSLANGVDRLVAATDRIGDGDANATFSPDGGTIFISISDGSDNSLWAYPARGGEPWRILSSGEYLGRLSASSNGFLAMEMQYPGGQLVKETPHSNEAPRPIEADGLKTWCVDYAQDGTLLATGWHSQTFGIWISGSDGRMRELLRLNNSLACAIRWSPDGTRFAYVQWLPNGFAVPVMTRDGQPLARLFYPGTQSGRLDWTADGKSILTTRGEKQGLRIWRTDLATNKSVPISPFGWLSPRVKGNMLFAEKDGVAGIWRIDGTPRRVTDGPAPEASDVYTIAGDKLIYSDTTDPDHPMFSAENINGGPKERLGPLPNGQINFVFGVDPKSGDIVYTIGTDDTDIGLLRLVRR